MGHFFFARAHANAGRFAKAVDSAAQAMALAGRTPEMLSLLAYASVMAGHRRRALALLSDLVLLGKRRYVSTALLAQVRIGLGRHEEAREDLEQALDCGDPERLYLDVRTAYDPLRASPEFVSPLKRAGFGG